MLKRHLLVFVVSIITLLNFLPTSSLAGSWNGWIYQNPYPTSNTLLAVKFVTPKKGWAAGEYGIIIYTEDGGETWELQESGIWEDFKSIFFINEKTGWAVGNGGVIVHTEDGGKHWSHQGDIKTSLNKVFFINDKEGWAVGNKGIVLHTIDGGKKWQEKSIGTRQSIASVFFLDSKTGWLLAGKKVYKTTDSGEHWESITLQVYDPKDMIDEGWWEGDVFFLNNNEGWAVIGLSTIYHTLDGGKTWEIQLNDAGILGFKINKIEFLDEKNGCAAGSSILCTNDGGKTWNERLGIKQPYDEVNGFEGGFWGLSFPNETTAWAAGYGGLIMKTEDGGKSWKLKVKGVEKGFAYTLINAKTSFGNKDSSIFRTDDGGNTWQVQKKFEVRTGFSSWYFFNSTTGWMGGTHEKRPKSWNTLIVHTNDGGKTWQTQYDEPGDTILDMFFIDQSTGWAMGRGGLILHTKDGGKNWVHQKSGTKFWLKEVFFVDRQHGWVLGATPEDSWKKGMVLYTQDGGKHWQVQWSKQDVSLDSLFLINKDTGWITGQAGGEWGTLVLFSTKDGGKTWEEREFADAYSGNLLFLDKDRGVLLADKGRNYITKNGGKTWERRRDPVRKGVWHVSELFDKTQGNK